MYIYIYLYIYMCIFPTWALYNSHCLARRPRCLKLACRTSLSLCSGSSARLWARPLRAVLAPGPQDVLGVLPPVRGERLRVDEGARRLQRRDTDRLPIRHAPHGRADSPTQSPTHPAEGNRPPIFWIISLSLSLTGAVGGVVSNTFIRLLDA